MLSWRVLSAISLSLSLSCRLCVCDMDRLGRNEFIGEVRVALKKLKEGESKKYYMGLERIAQVCVCVSEWVIVAVVRLCPLEFVRCII